MRPANYFQKLYLALSKILMKTTALSDTINIINLQAKKI